MKEKKQFCLNQTIFLLSFLIFLSPFSLSFFSLSLFLSLPMFLPNKSVSCLAQMVGNLTERWVIWGFNCIPKPSTNGNNLRKSKNKHRFLFYCNITFPSWNNFEPRRCHYEKYLSANPIRAEISIFLISATFGNKIFC